MRTRCVLSFILSRFVVFLLLLFLFVYCLDAVVLSSLDAVCFVFFSLLFVVVLPYFIVASMISSEGGPLHE